MQGGGNKGLTARPVLVPTLKVADPVKGLGFLVAQDDLHAAVGDTAIRAVLGRTRRIVDARIGAEIICNAALAPDIAAHLNRKVVHVSPVSLKGSTG
jgi:hypothetical protein